MSKFTTDLINKTDMNIFDEKRFNSDKKILKQMIEDNIRAAKNNYNSLFNKITQTGDTMAYYRYELLELDKLDFKTIRKSINSTPMTFHTKMKECKDYTDFFNSKFKINSWDTNFQQQFYIFLFLHYDSTKVSISKMIDDFYIDYEKRWGYIPNRIDFSEIAKVLHFIRKGNTPLYNVSYRDFFILKKIEDVIPKDKDINAENELQREEIKRDLKKEVFKKQFDFIRAIFNEIIANSWSTSKSTLYNYSKFFDEFEKKFYITDKGVTKHKMIDYAILYFN